MPAKVFALKVKLEAIAVFDILIDLLGSNSRFDLTFSSLRVLRFSPYHFQQNINKS